MRKILLICTALPLALAGCSDDRPEVGRQPNLNQALLFREQLFADASSEESSEEAPSVDLVPESFVTVTGEFLLAGDAPAMGALKIDKQTDVCLPGGTQVLENKLELNPQNRGIKNVLIFVEGIPDSWIHESARSNDSEAVFDQKYCLFVDHVLAVQTSQNLLLKNSDPIGHNTLFNPRSNPPINVTIDGGTSTSYTPQKAESLPFKVSCTVHPWMEAFMIFRDNGYFAVSDADGKFEIRNLPAGVPLKLKIWHEMAPSLKSVTLGSEKVVLKRGIMEQTFAPEQPASLAITIDAAQLK